MRNERSKYLLKLVQILSYDDSMLTEVRLAVNSPKDYVNKFSKQLKERGIKKPTDNLAWIALVESLNSRNLLQELDWKDDAEELIEVTLSLTERQKNYKSIQNTLLKVNALLGDDIEEFLPILNKSLEKEGIQLIWLDIDSDSYPLTIIDLKNVKKAKELALKAEYGKIK